MPATSKVTGNSMLVFALEAKGTTGRIFERIETRMTDPSPPAAL